ELLEGLHAEEPGNGEYVVAQARSYNLRATAEGQQGHMESALADTRRVLEVLDEGAPNVPRSSRQRRGEGFLHYPSSGVGPSGGRGEIPWPALLLLGQAFTNQGTLLSMSGRNGEAARFLEQAIAVHQRLLEINSRASPFRHGIALALLHSGRVK